MGPVSKGDKVALLENGTVKADKVALRDLAFWLPYTGEYLGKVVPFAPSFDELIRLPVAQIGFILSVVIKIIRKNRNVTGERLSNCTLKAKVDVWQRLMCNKCLDLSL